MRIVKSIIQAAESGQPLEAWLTSRFTYRDLESWRSEIARGRLEVAGCRAEGAYLLQQGDVVRYFPEEIEEPEVSRDIEILYEDDLILVVNKPGNLPCHPSGKFFRHTLWYMLQEKYGKIHLLHRLDRDTSGLMVIAKNKFAARQMGRQFMRRQLQKHYQLVVHGEIKSRIVADGWLLKDVRSAVRKKRRFVYSLDGFENPQCCETASTTFVPVRSNGEFSLVDVELGSGRLHQIRATAYSLGFPVVGDRIYGKDETIYLRYVDYRVTAADREALILNRQALHACRLAFIHPTTGEDMNFKLPVDNQLLKQLRLET